VLKKKVRNIVLRGKATLFYYQQILKIVFYNQNPLAVIGLPKMHKPRKHRKPLKKLTQKSQDMFSWKSQFCRKISRKTQWKSRFCRFPVVCAIFPMVCVVCAF
jgi:hypothetical protein